MQTGGRPMQGVRLLYEGVGVGAYSVTGTKWAAPVMSQKYTL